MIKKLVYDPISVKSEKNILCSLLLGEYPKFFIRSVECIYG